MAGMKTFILPALLVCTAMLRAQTPPLRHQSFDSDPKWEAVNNRMTPKKAPVAEQDFGFSPTQNAGKAPGEMGGRIQRATTPASYARPISKTLNDKLTASGAMAVTTSSPGGGAFFGFFQSKQPGGSGRPIGSLGMNLDFEGQGGRLAVRLITDGNQSCGTFITPYVPGRFRPTPLRSDGTRYRFQLEYDPDAANGNGRFTFEFQCDGADPDQYLKDPQMSGIAIEEARRRFPKITRFAVDLPPGYKTEGAHFDRFGLINMMKSGGWANLYFDDLVINGEPQDFSADPHWAESGNRGRFTEEDHVATQNFGFSPETRNAGGKPGEIGGAFWRTQKDWGYYADRLGPLSLEDRIEARGKVVLVAGGPDADMALGFFDSRSIESPPTKGANFLGICVGGPTRYGHMFRPGYTTAKGTIGKVERGPALKPGRSYDWSLIYDPAAAGGAGEIRLTLGDESVTLPLKPGRRAEGARFDRFGLFSVYPGGQLVKLYIDDLSYTASRAP